MFTVPGPELDRAAASVAVPAFVANPAVVAAVADPTVPIVVDQIAVFADDATSTDPDAPGAVAAATFTVPVASVRAFAIVAVPATVAVPALVVTLADPVVPVVVDQIAEPVLEEVSTDPAAPGAAPPLTFTVPVVSARASAVVAVPDDDAPPDTTVAVWMALPVGT